MSGCFLDAFFEEAIFFMSILLLSTSVLNDNCTLINPHKHMSTKVKLTKTIIIINENEYDIASCCFELYS